MIESENRIGDFMKLKIIERFEKAVREEEMCGAKDPKDWDRITQEYFYAQEELIKYIKRLERRARR